MADGDVYGYGDAAGAGSQIPTSLAAPIVGVAMSAADAGYWLAGADGGVFALGRAPFFGSVGGERLAAPITGIAADPDNNGYWLVGADGGVYAFGGAPFLGSLPGLGVKPREHTRGRYGDDARRQGLLAGRGRRWGLRLWGSRRTSVAWQEHVSPPLWWASPPAERPVVAAMLKDGPHRHHRPEAATPKVEPPSTSH